MTHYYYDKERNEFRGPLEFDYNHTAIGKHIATLPTIPHTFTGHSRIVPEGEIEWRYEITTTKGWKECREETYNILPDVQRRRVATPKITAQPDKPENGKTDDLLDCPFCGGRPEWIHLAHPSGIPALQCFECKFSMQQDRRDKTIFFWNRRTPHSPQTGEKELKAGDAWEKYITQFPKLHEFWKAMSPVTSLWLAQQIDIFANKYPAPPAAQPDQEAAERYNALKVENETLARIIDIKEKERMEWANMCIKKQQRIEELQAHVTGFAESIDRDFMFCGNGIWRQHTGYQTTTTDLYALFTARHPTPKPGSHDTEGKEGPGC